MPGLGYVLLVAYEDLNHARLVRLIEVGRALLSRLDLEEVLEAVLEAARDLTGARFAALGILDEQKEQLERFITVGVDRKVHEDIGELPLGRGVLGEIIRSPEPLRLTDVGAHQRSFGFPRGHPVMHTFLGVPVKIRGEAWGNLYLAEKKDGDDFSAADEAAVTVLADWAALAVENARLYGGLAAHRDELQRRTERLEHSLRALAVMTDISQAVGGETQLERVLELIVKRGRALVEARALVILLAEGDDLVVAAVAGDLGTQLAGARVPIEGTLPGQVLRSREAERLVASGRVTAELSDLGIGAEAVMLVPLTFRSTASGVLAAFDRVKDGPEFNSEDERLLRSFAASAATAVATAQSVEAERLRHSIEASEQERRRWARELHDQTLQTLGGLRMLHQAALRSDDPEALRRALEESVELIDEEIENVSVLIAELRPAALDELGLEAALSTLAERKAAAGGFEVELEVNGLDGGRLDPELESAVYRLAQESLNNIVKHAGASHVKLTLDVGDRIELVVTDDGDGFDTDNPSRGFGLTGMRERAELAGGSVEITSRPGEGTTVRASLPGALAAPLQSPGM